MVACGFSSDSGGVSFSGTGGTLNILQMGDGAGGFTDSRVLDDGINLTFQCINSSQFILTPFADTLTDGGTLNSPSLSLFGAYDSDVGGGITPGIFTTLIKTIVTGAGAAPTGYASFSVQGNEGLTINEAGFVGINTNSQTSQFQVKGIDDLAGTANVQFTNDNNDVLFEQSNDGHLIMRSTTTGAGEILRMENGGGGGGLPVFTMKDSGVCGIGINAPSGDRTVAIIPTNGIVGAAGVGIGDDVQVLGFGGVGIGNDTVVSTGTGVGQDIIGTGNSSVFGTFSQYNPSAPAAGDWGGVFGGSSLVLGAKTLRAFILGSQGEIDGGGTGANDDSMIVGPSCRIDTATGAIVMGSGADSTTNRLLGNIDDTLFIGFRSLTPSIMMNKGGHLLINTVTAPVAGTHFDSNATNIITLHKGSAPSAGITGAAEIYVDGADNKLAWTDEDSNVHWLNTSGITEISTATYTLAETDLHLSYQRTDTGTGIVTLPAISASNHGKVYHVKDADYNANTNNITIDTTGSDTVEEVASIAITIDGDSFALRANNTTKNWEGF